MAPGTKSKEQSDKTLSAINILGKEKEKERKRKGIEKVITDSVLINFKRLLWENTGMCGLNQSS